MRERLEPTEADGLNALEGHAIERAEFARRNNGRDIGYDEILAMLDDPEVVRFPTRIRFDGELLAGEFAHAEPVGGRPSDGYTLYVHPAYADQPGVLPKLIAYHLVRVNYGDMATCDAAESFGAALLGLDREQDHAELCRISDELGASA